MRGALLLLIVAGATAVEAQQPGSLQISTDTQVVQGNPQRRATERTWEPDFGALWSQPGTRFGQVQVELRGARRGNGIHLGRTWLALRDAKAHGLSWTFEAGDLYTSPAPIDAQFSNLSAPSITFTGGSLAAKSAKTTFQLVGGRSTAWRNIFGTDPDTLGQSIGLARATYQATPRVQLLARGSRVRTSNLKEFTRTIDASDQGGAGVRFVLTPALHLVADGSYVRYRATGATAAVDDYSYLAGAHLLIARGWVQVNASRFSPGDLPVLNASLQDRSGVFSAGEYDVFSRLRLFGGWETIDTNIHPTGTALQRPMATSTRQFGGVRLRLAPRSSISIRKDAGDRISTPALAPLGTAAPSTTAPALSTSDTGSFSAELQSSVGRLTSFGRYTRRENVDSTFSSATYTQQDSALQLFYNLARRSQLFGTAMLTNTHSVADDGSSYLQFSAGGQQQLFRQGLWMRVEGTASRNHDRSTRFLVPRDALSVGLNGQISAHTTIGFNVYVDRAPAGFPGDSQAWLARSTIRVVHTIPTGSVRVANATGVGARAGRGTGTVTGSVFADWNANGQPDPGEEALAGIPIALGMLSHITTGRDGQFAFLNVPSGAQQVRLDLNALPVDFDAPQATDLTLEISRGETRRVAFGLLPLGGIAGRVYEDANKNGRLDAGEAPLDSAVVVLDGGQRSELVRKGAFRFDAVRAGAHRLELLKESLPEGATIVGTAERSAPIARDAPLVDVTYLVTIEKRPEVRKVFPPKGGGGAGAAAARAGAARTVPAGRPPAPAPEPAPKRAAAAAAAAAPSSIEPYTIQVAALTDAPHARAIVEELKRVGFDAYLVEPPGNADGLYRVRVGTYRSRGSAQPTMARLEDHLGLKLWLTRNR